MYVHNLAISLPFLLRNWLWHLSYLKQSTFTYNYWWKGIVVGLPDSSILSVSGCLLKGSVGELSRWRRMIDRSMMFPEGSITGSVISVSIRGSVTTQSHAFLQRIKTQTHQKQQPTIFNLCFYVAQKLSFMSSITGTFYLITLNTILIVTHFLFSLFKVARQTS